MSKCTSSLFLSLQVAVFCRQVSCFLVRDMSVDTRGPSSTNYTNGHECEELRRCYQSPTVSQHRSCWCLQRVPLLLIHIKCCVMYWSRWAGGLSLTHWRTAHLTAPGKCAGKFQSNLMLLKEWNCGVRLCLHVTSTPGKSRLHGREMMWVTRVEES